MNRSVVLNQLVGQPETEVVRQLGVPSRSFDSGGHKFLAYNEQHAAEIYGGGLYGVGGSGGFYGRGFGGFPAEIVQYSCETTFDVVGGRVVTWALRGNACD